MVAVVLSASGVYIMLTLVILPTHHQCCRELQASAGHGGFRVLLENYRVSYTPTLVAMWRTRDPIHRP